MENSNIILNKLTAIESLLEATNQTKPNPWLYRKQQSFWTWANPTFTSSPVSAKFHTSSQAVRRFILTSLSLYSGSSASQQGPGKKRRKKRQAILFPGKGQYETRFLLSLGINITFSKGVWNHIAPIVIHETPTTVSIWRLLFEFWF